MPKRLTTEIFIKRSILKHGKRYDYSLIKYKNAHSKVKIICPIHGVFEQIANDHLNGSNCPLCKNRYTTKIFIEKSKLKHGNKYDYSLVNYVDNKTKVEIICPIHGVFEQLPLSHLSGHNCRMCFNDSKLLSIDDYIKKSNLIHDNKYDYSLVKYNNKNDFIKIICPIHGVFEQNRLNHHKGIGCPLCSTSSIGELHIQKFLIKSNIIFIKEKRFNDCRYKYPLPFDFYLPEYNTCIEFDGIQHFEPIEYFGGEKNFIYIQRCDRIKNNFCLDNNINLLRIKYKDNIIDKLNKILK